MKEKTHADKGFSILEVLVGVTIFCLGMLGVFGMQISTMQRNAFTADYTEATFLAVSRLERLYTLPAGHADLTDKQSSGAGSGLAGLDSVDALADGTQSATGKNNIFTVFWNVANNQPRQGATTIKVTVRWYAKTQERTVAVRSIREF